MVRLERKELDVCAYVPAPSKSDGQFPRAIVKGKGARKTLKALLYGLLEHFPEEQWRSFYLQILDICKIVRASDIANEILEKPQTRMKWGYLEEENMFELCIGFKNDMDAKFCQSQLSTYFQHTKKI